MQFRQAKWMTKTLWGDVEVGRKKNSWCPCPLAAVPTSPSGCWRASRAAARRVKDAEICHNRTEYAGKSFRELISSLTTSVSSPAHPLCQRRTSQGDLSRGDQISPLYGLKTLARGCQQVDAVTLKPRHRRLRQPQKAVWNQSQW